MSGVAVARPRWLMALAAHAPPDSLRVAGLRLAAFAALAAYATGHWARLVADPPIARLGAGVLVALTLGAALVALGRSRLPRSAMHGVAAVLALAATALGLSAVGVPAALLEPGRWGELAGAVDRGLAGVQATSWPYTGPDEWIRLVILMGAPALLTLAGALAFWPAQRGAGALRGLAIVCLLALYAISVTEHDPGEPLLRGLVLLALAAAWLCLPALNRSEARPAAAVLVAVAVLSLPVAARLDGSAPLLGYGEWDWFRGKDVTFNWNHSYGPLDWPREGTTLLSVRADRPHYWKAQTLDRFDGLRWVRSSAGEGARPIDELPPRPDPEWSERIRVTVRALRTDFVIGAGTPYLVVGAGEALAGSADGTVRRLNEPLERGDSYTVRTYDPDPSRRRLRLAPGTYDAALARYVAIVLPQARPAISRAGRPSSETVNVGLRGGAIPATPGVARRLAGSPYARTFRLAQRLTGGAPTVYDAVRRVERHLEQELGYSERPPRRRYPLEAFLFRDKIGYCQQFSGAMALMLRMAGIPARVVSGFSPGSFNRDTREYRVRDLDAHSWVEVYFSGIGWVTFDPTPAAAPADRAAGESSPSPEAGATFDGGGSDSGGGAEPERPVGEPRAAPAESGGGAPGWIAAAAVAAVLAGVALVALGRRLSDPADAEARLRELERALPRLGWEVGPRTTLLELERRLAKAAGPRSARYVARLRAGRFAPRGTRTRAPSRAARRALRSELTAAGGLRLRVRGFLALPPHVRFTRS